MSVPAGERRADFPAGPRARPALRRDVATLARVLSRAFLDDPLACYLISRDRTRAAGLRRFFAIEMRSIFLPRGAIYTTEEQQGAALWAPPDMARRDLHDFVRLFPMLMYVGLGDMGRTQRLFGRLDAARPAYPHWYLATVGTEPSLQGRGIGSSLLQAVLARCDEEGLPAYLESSKEVNVPFYRRHGWEVVQELRVEPQAPPLWLMLREPRPAGTWRMTRPGD